MAEAKTNAMRMLERAKIPYEIHTYDHSDGQIDWGQRSPAKVGLDPEYRLQNFSDPGLPAGRFTSLCCQ